MIGFAKRATAALMAVAVVFGTLFFIYYINQINKEIKDLNMEINKSKIFGPKFK